MAASLQRRIAIVVDPAPPIGLLGNAIAVCAVDLGAASPDLGGARLRQAAGRSVRSSAKVSVPALQATADPLLALLDEALASPKLDAVVGVPVFARAIHDSATCRLGVENCDLAGAQIAALGIAREAEAVRRITRGLSLLR